MVSKRKNNPNQSIPRGSLSEETRKSMEGTSEKNEEKIAIPVQQIAQTTENNNAGIVNGSHGINTTISDSMYVRMMEVKLKSRKTLGTIYREALEMYLKSLGV